MNERKLNVGIIGLGVGEKHIPAFDGHPGCKVVALCDFSKERLSAASELCPEAKLKGTDVEILENPDIDIVSIASFDNFHYGQIVSAIKNGKHVFVEKPLCLHFDEAKKIRKLLNEKPGTKLSSNLNLRTCPRFKDLKKAIESNEIGRVIYAEGDYFWGRIHKLTEGWRTNMPFYSIVHGAAVHMIDLLMWVTGLRPVEVQGYGNRIATSDSELRYNDFAAILMKFKNGVVAKVSANGGCVHPHFHRVAISGTQKTFIHDVMGAGMLESRDANAEMLEVTGAYPAVEAKGEIIVSFVDSIIDSNAEAIVTTDDVFVTMSVCFAAERAIQEGKPVQVDYI